MEKEVSIKKNEEYVVEIIDNGFEGEGIAKINNFTIFIPGTIKGEKVKILIVKVLSSHAFGKILEFIEKSNYRVEIDCNTYNRCGGCNLRHIDYEYTLDMKQNAVQSLVNKTLNNKIKVENTVAMGNPFYYRNKLQYPVGKNKKGETIIGVFANRSHEIIPVKNCMIQDKDSNQIIEYILEILKKYNISVYDEKTQKGLMRHVIIKKAFRTEQIMIILVINGEKIPYAENIASDLHNRYSQIASVVLNINKNNTNVILGNKSITIFGNDYISDYLGDYIFNISPMSFFQVNPIQAEALYNYAIEQANISKNDIVFDLYCGIGTISIFMSKYAKKVYGVEIVEQAIEMAKENAICNNIDNVEFIAGDTEQVLTDLIENKKIVPNIVLVDPPRKGLDNITINNILKIKPRKVIYISCNPASLVRDLSKLENMYDVISLQPFDMFPFTSHVECCASLYRKNVDISTETEK